jgi:hypothetical protein
MPIAGSPVIRFLKKVCHKKLFIQVLKLKLLKNVLVKFMQLANSSMFSLIHLC